MFGKAIPCPGSIAALRARPLRLTEAYGERRPLADPRGFR